MPSCVGAIHRGEPKNRCMGPMKHLATAISPQRHSYDTSRAQRTVHSAMNHQSPSASAAQNTHSQLRAAPCNAQPMPHGRITCVSISQRSCGLGAVCGAGWSGAGAGQQGIVEAGKEQLVATTALMAARRPGCNCTAGEIDPVPQPPAPKLSTVQSKVM